MRRQCSSTESSHPVAERSPSDLPPFPSAALSTCLPDLESHPSADPSLTSPLTVVPRDSQSTAPATMSMHLYMHHYMPSWLLSPPVWRTDAGGEASQIPRGDRTPTIGVRWMNVDQGRHRIEATSSRCFLPQLGIFPGNLIVRIESKGQASALKSDGMELR